MRLGDADVEPSFCQAWIPGISGGGGFAGVIEAKTPVAAGSLAPRSTFRE
jgi:hypothetical protein